METLQPEELRRQFPHTRPVVLDDGPIFGFGYRAPWRLGNEIQARAAVRCNLSVMLAQQSAREIQLAGRTFQEVIDSATCSAYTADLRRPWGADGDRLRNVQEVVQAAQAGCTHFTYDVSHEAPAGMDAIVCKLRDLYQITLGLLGHRGFTTEIAMDETAAPTRLEDIHPLMAELARADVRVTELAPRFPGHFEPAVDYYTRMEGDRRVADLEVFEQYLDQLAELGRRLGFRISVHAGSDKFSLYPIMARVLGADFHLKTSGTYCLEELKIIARHDRDLFLEIHACSAEHCKRLRGAAAFSAAPERIPALDGLSGAELGKLLQAGAGNADLRQVLHTGYGAVLAAADPAGRKLFAGRMERLLRAHLDEYAAEMETHLLRHIRPFVPAAG